MIHLVYLTIIAALGLLLWRARRHNRWLIAEMSMLAYRLAAARLIYEQACQRNADAIAWAEYILVCQQKAMDKELLREGSMLHVN